jgi:Ca2+-binding EF-hand superfamily protein
MAANDVKMVFEHLDKNMDHYISYKEFCGLCEEIRRDIDPFELTTFYAEIQKNYA